MKILIIIISALFLNLFLDFLINFLVSKKIKERKKTKTLISVFEGTASFIIIISAILMILPELGINITPLLAGVGVLGLAVGMASREIVSDFLSGIFIIIEDQYYVGDRIKVLNIEGKVKEITLRRTCIEDDNGFLHSICNSQIKTIAKKIL